MVLKAGEKGWGRLSPAKRRKEVGAMAERYEVYKCAACGNIVEVLDGGEGELVCCGEPMKLFKENTVDAAKEKHVPVIEKVEGGYKVKVGSVPHPMTPAHWIEWIELMADGKVCRQFLTPSDKPEAIFPVIAEKVSAREWCNLHGLWKS
jgi:superoxide reductase